jgi:hypothetical protein
MKMNLRVISFALAAVGLFAVASANADTLNAKIWAGQSGNVPVTGSAIYGTTPDNTATITNADPSAILNFSSNTDSSLLGFLTTGVSGTPNGDVVVLSGPDAQMNNDLFQFTGTVSLTDGTYGYEHDDGMILYLNGSPVINAPGPTSATSTAFTVCASGCDAVAGNYSFELDYGEVAGPPAVLQGNLPFVASATPEPSSFVLLGSGLLGAAGMLRRRMKKS